MNASNQRIVRLPTRGFICESCGEVGFPRTVTKGSFLIEIILWCCFILPGLAYTIWRLTNRVKVCPDCGGHMIPIRSPGGRLLAQRFNPHVTIQ